MKLIDPDPATAALIRTRPVTAFLIITFLVSYVGGLSFNAAISSLLQPSGLTATYLPTLVTVLGPGLAALIVARIGAGRLSTQTLIGSLRVSKRHATLIAVVIVVGVVIAFSAFALAGIPTTQLLTVMRGSALLLAAHLVLQLITAGIGGELGWRGCLLPHLAAERSFASAVMLTGVAWTIWHLPSFLAGGSVALSYLALLSAMSVILAWLWLRSDGSAGVAAVAHAVVNGSFLFFESHVRELVDGGAIAVRAFAYAAGMYLCIAIVIALVGWRRLAQETAPAS